MATTPKHMTFASSTTQVHGISTVLTELITEQQDSEPYIRIRIGYGDNSVTLFMSPEQHEQFSEAVKHRIGVNTAIVATTLADQ
jgi:hypothetical protein